MTKPAVEASNRGVVLFLSWLEEHDWHVFPADNGRMTLKIRNETSELSQQEILDALGALEPQIARSCARSPAFTDCGRNRTRGVSSGVGCST